MSRRRNGLASAIPPGSENRARARGLPRNLGGPSLLREERWKPDGRERSGAAIARIPAVAIDGPIARVTATTVTRFTDNREPSVEDDLIYLRSQGGRWLIAQPSTTLYRAIGVGDIPPEVLAPP